MSSAAAEVRVYLGDTNRNRSDYRWFSRSKSRVREINDFCACRGLLAVGLASSHKFCGIWKAFVVFPTHSVGGALSFGLWLIMLGWAENLLLAAIMISWSRRPEKRANVMTMSASVGQMKWTWWWSLIETSDWSPIGTSVLVCVREPILEMSDGWKSSVIFTWFTE